MIGRPPKYETPEELEKKIDEYFEDVTKPTITGLALFLGFESRQSFYDYEKNGNFSYIIKRARLHIESIYEESLHSQSCTGAIFALKNFGWKDKQEVEQNGIMTNINLTVDSADTARELKKLIGESD